MQTTEMATAAQTRGYDDTYKDLLTCRLEAVVPLGLTNAGRDEVMDGVILQWER